MPTHSVEEDTDVVSNFTYFDLAVPFQFSRDKWNFNFCIFANVQKMTRHFCRPDYEEEVLMGIMFPSVFFHSYLFWQLIPLKDEHNSQFKIIDKGNNNFW